MNTHAIKVIETWQCIYASVSYLLIQMRSFLQENTFQLASFCTSLNVLSTLKAPSLLNPSVPVSGCFYCQLPKRLILARQFLRIVCYVAHWEINNEECKIVMSIDVISIFKYMSNENRCIIPVYAIYMAMKLYYQPGRMQHIAIIRWTPSL